MGLDQISFLPADVTSEAFNRPQPWEKDRQESVLVNEEELEALGNICEEIIRTRQALFENRFIAESPGKLRKIHQYYAAHWGRAAFPGKKCNAPWVSAVVEADGSVRPCFFHDVMGNIRENSLDRILNSAAAIYYRRNLDVQKNHTCARCVCSLKLGPRESRF